MKIEIVCPPGYTAKVTYTRPPGIRIPFTNIYVSLEDPFETETPIRRSIPLPPGCATAQAISPEDAFKMYEEDKK